MSDMLNRDWPKTWSSKMCTGSAIVVFGKATSDIPMDRAVLPSGKRTCSGCSVGSMLSCDAEEYYQNPNLRLRRVAVF